MIHIFKAIDPSAWYVDEESVISVNEQIRDNWTYSWSPKTRSLSWQMSPYHCGKAVVLSAQAEEINKDMDVMEEVRQMWRLNCVRMLQNCRQQQLMSPKSLLEGCGNRYNFKLNIYNICLWKTVLLISIDFKKPIQLQCLNFFC